MNTVSRKFQQRLVSSSKIEPQIPVCSRIANSFGTKLELVIHQITLHQRKMSNGQDTEKQQWLQFTIDRHDDMATTDHY
jgi:hypothetical protein